MSNGRKLKDRTGRASCATCGRSVTAYMALTSQHLADGRVVCPRCVGQGRLALRLGCGHVGLPGMTVTAADEPGMSRCARCSGELDGG